MKIVGQALQDAIERDGDLFLYPLPAQFLNNLILSPWITTVSWSLELRPPLGDRVQVAFWRWWLDEAVPAAYRAIPNSGHERATALTISSGSMVVGTNAAPSPWRCIRSSTICSS